MRRWQNTLLYLKQSLAMASAPYAPRDSFFSRGRNKRYRISMRHPQRGAYALALYASGTNTHVSQPYSNTCKYVITPVNISMHKCMYVALKLFSLSISIYMRNYLQFTLESYRELEVHFLVLLQYRATFDIKSVYYKCSTRKFTSNSQKLS